MSALLNRLLGAFFIGVVASSILYGVTLLQVYLYFTEHASKDGVFLKSFVAMLMVLDSIHLAFLCHGLYIAAVTNFGNLLADLHAPCLCHYVYSTILRRQDLPAEPKKEYLYTTRYQRDICNRVWLRCCIYREKPYGATALSLEVADGVFITVCMVYYVLKQRSGVKSRANRVVNLVVLYIVNSGALNLVFASTCLITYVNFLRR
ncbi:hypothetical protein EI94DRAFT_167849 [Lactarius quietus]|nr:hypothetical protein EI94DRAFT_167849 [Lactarius quietus]